MIENKDLKVGGLYWVKVLSDGRLRRWFCTYKDFDTIPDSFICGLIDQEHTLPKFNNENEIFLRAGLPFNFSIHSIFDDTDLALMCPGDDIEVVSFIEQIPLTPSLLHEFHRIKNRCWYYYITHNYPYASDFTMDDDIITAGGVYDVLHEQDFNPVAKVICMGNKDGNSNLLECFTVKDDGTLIYSPEEEWDDKEYKHCKVYYKLRGFVNLDTYDLLASLIETHDMFNGYQINLEDCLMKDHIPIHDTGRQLGDKLVFSEDKEETDKHD